MPTYQFEDPQGWREHLWLFLRYPPTWMIQVGVVLFLLFFFLVLPWFLREWMPLPDGWFEWDPRFVEERPRP